MKSFFILTLVNFAVMDVQLFKAMGYHFMFGFVLLICGIFVLYKMMKSE